MKRRKSFETDVLPDLLRALRKQIRVLEGTVDALQQGQTRVPPPRMKEIAEMRSGKRPLSREAFLLGAYQRLLIEAENLISDLRSITHTTAWGAAHALEVDFNAIEAAVSARHSKGKA